jgi:hypothetical protein
MALAVIIRINRALHDLDEESINGAEDGVCSALVSAYLGSQGGSVAITSKDQIGLGSEIAATDLRTPWLGT